MPPRHNLQPQALGGCVDIRVLLSDLWTILNKMCISNFYLMYWGKKGVVGGGGYLRSDLFWLWKSKLEILISNQKSPFWSLYKHPFYKNHVCPQDINYNACPRALGALSTLEFLLYVLWIISNKMATSKCLR